MFWIKFIFTRCSLILPIILWHLISSTIDTKLVTLVYKSILQYSDLNCFWYNENIFDFDLQYRVLCNCRINFISNDPQFRFTMVQCTFEMALPKTNTKSKTKYNHYEYVANLPLGAALLVRYVILNPDKTHIPFQSRKNIVNLKMITCVNNLKREIKCLHLTYKI